MMNQYADSEPAVNAQCTGESETQSESGLTLAAMGKTEKVAEPVSEYIRFLIERWEADGKLLKDLASAAQLAKSMPSQIKARTSDASFYSASKLAVPLGYRDLPELVVAAYAWWRSADRTQLPEERPAGSVVEEAIGVAMRYDVTQAQIDRVLQRLPPDRYPDETLMWWLSRFHEEQSLDRLAEASRSARVRNPLAGSTSVMALTEGAKSARKRANEDAKVTPIGKRPKKSAG